MDEKRADDVYFEPAGPIIADEASAVTPEMWAAAVQPARWFTCTECGGLFCDEVATMCVDCAPSVAPQ